VAADDKPVEKKEPEKKADAKLTHASLLALLKKLGHEPVVYGTNKTDYQLTVNLENFRSVFSVHLSSDQSRLWLLAHSGKLTDVKAIPPAVLRKLVQLNSDQAPFHFTLDEKAARVYMLFSVPNKEITSAFLTTMLDEFAGAIKRTWNDWRYETLQPAR